MNKLNLGKKIYLGIFALIVAFVGIFGVFWSQKDSISKVSADSVSNNYVFNGSGFLVRATTYSADPDPNDSNSLTSTCYFKINSLTSTSFELSFKLYADGLNPFTAICNDIVYNDWQYFRVNQPFSVPSVHYIVQYYIESDFNANVMFIDIESNKWAGVNNDIAQTQFVLTDSNGKVARFFVFGNFLAWSEVNGIKHYSSFSYEPRRYYLINNFSNNDYYQSGYSNGFSAGKNEGITEGTQTGYNNGYNVGKNVGFDEGVASANDYSFLGLIGAVVDAPLGVFIDTFNFEILGFNLKDFFLALLTVALVITIVRLCMGGK